MKSSRWPLAVAIAIVGAGLVASGVAFLATRTSGPETSLSFVPDSATVVAQVDVRAIASSPLADTWTQRAHTANEKGGPADAIFDAVGIDVLHDVETVTFSFAGKGDGGAADRWGISATGSFDTEALLEKVGQSDLEPVEHAGTRIHRFVQDGKNGKKESGLAVLRGGSMLLLGETGYLREMLDAGEGRSASASALLESVGPEGIADETFWVLGSTSGEISSMLGESNLLPPLQSFALSGRLDAELVLRARGRAENPEAAQQLADVLRGLVALGRMNAGNTNPELAGLAKAVSIELYDRDLEINLSVPYETIQKLSERSRKEGE